MDWLGANILWSKRVVSKKSEPGSAGAEAVIIIWTCGEVDVAICTRVQACDGTNELKAERPMDLFERFEGNTKI